MTRDAHGQLAEEEKLELARAAYKKGWDMFANAEDIDEQMEAAKQIAKSTEISDKYIYPHLALGKIFDAMEDEKYVDDIVSSGEAAYDMALSAQNRLLAYDR